MTAIRSAARPSAGTASILCSSNDSSRMISSETSRRRSCKRSTAFWTATTMDESCYRTDEVREALAFPIDVSGALRCKIIQSLGGVLGGEGSVECDLTATLGIKSAHGLAALSFLDNRRIAA